MRPFAYHHAADVADAPASLGGQAAILAGGTTMVDLMKLEVMTPPALVDITGSPSSPASTPRAIR